MKIEQQVCTLEQAKRLKELGIMAPAIWQWLFPAKEKMISTTYGIYHYEQAASIITDNEGDEFDHTSAPAYTVAELCQLLPDYYPSWRFPVDGDEKWIATVIASPKPPGVDDIHTLHEFDRYGDTQAEALATLLIALLETGTVTIEEVNSKLNQP